MLWMQHLPLLLRVSISFTQLAAWIIKLGEETGLDQIYCCYRHIDANLPTGIVGSNILYLFIYFACSTFLWK